MPPVLADRVWRNVGQLVTVAGSGPADLGILRDAAIAARDGRIVWIGGEHEADVVLQSLPGAHIENVRGHLVTPGFVDSHTHLVWAGNRAAEFHERLSGTSYAEQLRSGRGILATVEATRRASEAALLEAARERLQACLRYGSTTVEIKTGYGLDIESEDRCLRVIEQLQSGATDGPAPRVVPTFMGAHVVPREHHAMRAAYVREIIDQMLPAFAGRARFCDVFCEQGAFDVHESRAILQRAAELGYAVKVHANQFGSSGGVALAAELGATSADHLDHIDDREIATMREAGVVAVLLPGCSMTLSAPYPSGRRLIDGGVRVAISTDYNPGTCCCENMQLMLSLACLHMGMTIEEALRSATLHGAHAVGLENEVGSLDPGKQCDLLVWRVRDYLELGYSLGANRIAQVVVGGEVACAP